MPGWNWQKVKANAKQHTETELLLFKNYLFFHPGSQQKIIGDILKNEQKTSASALMKVF